MCTCLTRHLPFDESKAGDNASTSRTRCLHIRQLVSNKVGLQHVVFCFHKKMEWSNTQVFPFLELYHGEPAIWNPKNPLHKNKKLHLNTTIFDFQHDDVQISRISANDETKCECVKGSFDF